jgi:hypothetical protein
MIKFQRFIVKLITQPLGLLWIFTYAFEINYITYIYIYPETKRSYMKLLNKIK